MLWRWMLLLVVWDVKLPPMKRLATTSSATHSLMLSLGR